MQFEMNPDFPRFLQERINKLKGVLDGVSTEFSGQDVEVIKVALRSRWQAVGDDARIGEPDLTTVATRVHLGKKVWLDDSGRIMSDE